MPAMRWQSVVKTIHIWIGLICGAFLCFTCLSGSIAVFRPELQAAFSPKVARPAQTGSNPVRTDLDDAVARVLVRNAGAQLTRVLLPAPNRNTFVLTWNRDRKARGASWESRMSPGSIGGSICIIIFSPVTPDAAWSARSARFCSL